MRAFILTACILLGTISQAQSVFGGLYDFRLKELIGGTQTKLTDLRFGKVTLELDGYAGASLKTQTPVFGVVVGKWLSVDSDGKLRVFPCVGVGSVGRPNFDFSGFKPGFVVGIEIAYRF